MAHTGQPAVTDRAFVLDGGSCDVDNSMWIVGDGDQVNESFTVAEVFSVRDSLSAAPQQGEHSGR